MVDYYTIEQEKTSKDFCKDVALILDSKFTNENLLKTAETSESPQSKDSIAADNTLPHLEESDIQVLADFIISWSSRKCDCLIKTYCDKLPILIQVYLQYSPSLLKSLWSQMLKIDETSQSQEVVNYRAQLLKTFQLIAFAAIKCFLQNFTLFQVKKLRNLELIEEEQQYLKIEPGFHTLLLRNVYTFCQIGKGLDMITSFFQDEDALHKLPILMAKEVCMILLCIRQYILKYHLLECISNTRPLVYRYLGQLPDTLIRDNKHNVVQIISSVADPLEKGPSFDLDVLKLALKYICSSVLVLKLDGLTSLNQQLYLFLEWKAKGFLADEHMLAKQYTNWIMENEIVERVLGRSGQGSFHPEVLKQSFVLLQFLATNYSLTTENVDALWEDTKDKHCSRQVFSNLSELAKYLEEDLVEHLLTKLTELPVEEHSIGSINLCYCLTRSHWACIQRAEGDTSGGEGQRHLEGACGKFEDNAYNSSTSSLVSTEAQAEDVNNDLDLEGTPMDTGMDGNIEVVNFSTEDTTPPLTEELPPLIPLPQSKFAPQQPDDKVDPMERQSSDTTQSYSLEADANPAGWDQESSSEYQTIFTKTHQGGSPIVIESVSKPARSLIQHLNTHGNSILWGLVQDGNIAKLPTELRDVVQRYLADLIKQIRFSEVIQHFIKACIANICQDKSMIFSLNLLLSLLSSPPSLFSGSYCAFTWAQSELSLMDKFFENWRRFICKVEEGKDIDPIYSIPKQLDARLDFLSSLASQSFPAKAYTLTCECVDEIWKSLVLNLNLPLMLRNRGFSWFDLQVNYMPQKIIVYLIQNKISDLEPSTIPLAGFSLLRRLFQYSSLSLATTTNPCLEQVWKIAMHHIENQISLSAIQFLNTSYFSRVDCSLGYEEPFIRRSIKCLSDGLRVLDTACSGSGTLQPTPSEPGQKENDKNTALILTRRVLELLLSHLSLFQERFAFHLRIWRLQGKPLERHCEERFPGISDRIGLHPPVSHSRGDGMRLNVMYNGYPDSYKTTLEVSSGFLLAELRAEVVYCLINAGKIKPSPCSSSEQAFPPLKITLEGQALLHDSDSKTLRELEMKENAVLHISHTSLPSTLPDAPISPSLLPPPNRKCIPHNLLVELEAIPLLLRVATVVYDPGEVLSMKVWKLLAMLPTYPDEMRKAKRALAGEASEWEKFLGLQPSEQDLFEQLYSLQAIQNLLLTSAQDTTLSPATRISGLTISIARLSTHMEFCLVGHNLSNASSQFSSSESMDKENMCPPGGDGGVEGWNCWYQAVLGYWVEILCLLCLHRVLEESSSGSDNDDLIDLSQDSFVHIGGSQVRKVAVPQYELQMHKAARMNILETKVDFLSLLSRALELASLANSECATIVCNRTWTLLVCWCQANPDSLMELLTRKDFSLLAERLLLHCHMYSVRRLARRNFKELYSESKDPSFSLTLLETLLQCSVDNTTLLNLSQEPPKVAKEGSVHQNPNHPVEASEQLLRQSGDCFQCVSDLIMWVYTSMRYSKNWKGNAFYMHSCYERLITRAPYEVIELICHKHFNRDTMDSPDVYLKGLLQIMTVLSKLSSDYTTSEQAKELVECLLLNLYPFKSYNPSDTNQSPLPTYCNMETRMHAVDLLEAMVGQNPKLFPLVAVAIKQNHPIISGTPWEYRPRDDLRDNPSGYCGISNLGATCYMASTIQQLYMIPPLRNAILAQNVREVISVNAPMFKELQKLFLHLKLSKRATYHPERFCREYIFDQQQLNPLEQRDMNEFFTDLLSKLEDISPLLKKTVKGLFGGVIANVVMSNECSHVSRNCEDFYSVRAKVADMPDLQASLQELTQTDVLDGDNKYTCSQCGVSVRAEKRACFAQLPSILCINTMRYTFNVATMVNEKVNTHFPFPLELDMNSFIESSNLASETPTPPPCHELDANVFNLHCTKYELVGVVVHTGTSEGGHYYAILHERDQTSLPMGKWYMFNDQQVTEFDPDNIGQECFGGDIPNAGLDQHTRRIFPGLLERSNSAYMLFYQRKDFRSFETITPTNPLETAKPVLLENNKFLREVYTFDQHYLQALWKMCRHCKQDKSGMLVAAVKVATQLLLTTIIHAKDRPNIRKCFDWLANQYKEDLELCMSFLDYLCQPQEFNWVVEMFYLCPIKPIREQFVSLLTTVIKAIRAHDTYTFYLDFPKVISEGDTYNVTISESTCSSSVSVAVIMKSVIDLMCIPDLMPGSTDFSPYFDFLNNFALLGLEECKLLTVYQVVVKIDSFFARGSRHGQAPTLAFEEGILSLVYDDHNNHPDSVAALLHTLLNYLLPDKLFSKEDLSSFIYKPGYPLMTQLACSQADRAMTVRTYIAIWQNNQTLISSMLDALFSALAKESRPKCGNIYQFLNIMISNLQDRNLILSSYLENIRQVFSLSALPYTIDFLSMVLIVYSPICEWVKKQMGEWLSSWLIESEDVNVRKKTMSLVCHLVPCPAFHEYASANCRRQDNQMELVSKISESGRSFLVEVVESLLQMLTIAAEISCRCDVHDGLVQYFQLLEKCSVGDDECKLFAKYFNEFWNLYHPRMATAHVDCHEDKNALFSYWLHVCKRYPPNIQCLLEHPTAYRDISVIYILATTEKAEVVKYNNIFLDNYYTLLRLTCEKSQTFAREISNQQNTHWAIDYILPHYNLTQNAVDELYKMLNIFAKLPSSGSFRRKIITKCLQDVPPHNITTLRRVLRYLIRCEEDAMKTFTSGGLVKLSDAYLNLNNKVYDTSVSHHVSTLTSDLTEILSIIELILKFVAEYIFKGTCPKDQLNNWKESRNQFIQTIVYTLNSFVSPCHKQLVIQILELTVKLYPQDTAKLLIPYLSLHHVNFHKESKLSSIVGPFFPRRKPNQDAPKTTTDLKHFQQFNMYINSNSILTEFGEDTIYDKALIEFYTPYHELVRSICEVQLTYKSDTRDMVSLVVLMALEGLRLRMDILPNFMVLIKTITKHTDTRIIETFYENVFFIELIKTMLFKDNNVLLIDNLFKFCQTFYPKIRTNISNEEWNTFFSNVNDSFLQVDSDPSFHMANLKTLIIFLKSNSFETLPSKLSDTLSQYCSKYLDREELVALSPETTDTSQVTESPHTPSQSESVEGKERKRHSTSLVLETTPKRNKIEDVSDSTQDKSEADLTVTPTQSSEMPLAISSPAIGLLKLLRELLND